MMHLDPCTGFRARLERSLEGRPMPRELQILSWHEHLLGCDACRELLQREEALEALLSSMPEPRLEPDLARRVLARLRRVLARTDGLDLLLELDREAQAPAGLARRVLERVRADEVRASDEKLERLLELDRELHIPAGLAAQVLAGLESARRQPVRRFPSRRFLLAAAAVAGFASLPLWFSEPERSSEPQRKVELAREGHRDAELRAFIEQGGLEFLDEALLWSADIDLEIALAASLDPRYETLLDYDEPLDPNGAQTFPGADVERRDG